VVVSNESGDGGEESGGRGDQGFGNARSDGAKAGATCGAESGKGVNDAPDGAKEADERSDAGGGGQPGHSLFDAADFFGGGELHADGDGLQRLEFLRCGIAGTGDLALEFAVAGGVDVGKRRARGDESLGIGNALGCAEDLQELAAFPLDAAKNAKLLENDGPGNQGKQKKKGENDTGDPTGLRDDFKNIADEDGGEQENDFNPSEKRKFN